MRLIDVLLDGIFPPRDTERMLRDADADSLPALINPHVHISGATALLPYRHPLVHATIVEAKFYGNRSAQRMLGDVLAEYLTETVADETAFGPSVLLVPVPLSGKRMRERGYNQAECIARCAAKRLDAMVDTRLLRRTRDTAAQTSMDGGARRANMQNAFAASSADPSATYILIDDVVTTGATLTDAARALRDAGAARVIYIALAH